MKQQLLTVLFLTAALKYHVAFRSYQQSTSGKSTVDSLDKWADKLVQENKWGILMIHGIAQGYAALSDPEILRGHLKHVKSREHDIWVDAFANIARYEKERDDANLTVSGRAGDLTCIVSDTLDPKLFNVPLTLVIDAKAATAARAMQANKELPVRVGKDSIQVQAVPDPLPITVTWK